MASKRRRRNRNDDEYYAEENAEVKRLRRRRRRLLVLLLLIVVVVVVAGPTIVGVSPLRNTLLGLSLPLDGWRVESQSGSFAWTSGQAVEQLSISDRAGNPLLKVESIEVDRSLWSLVADRNGPLKVTIVRPTLSVSTRADGSNLEDLLVALSAGPNDKEGKTSSEDYRRNVSIEVVDGTIHGFDAVTERQWLLRGANVSTQITGADEVEIQGGATLSSSPDSQPGQVKFRMVQSAGLLQQLEVLSEQLPLEPLEPWLRRVLPSSRVTGRVSSDANFSWVYDQQGAATLQTSGHIEANGVDVVAEALGGDRLHFDRLEVPWKLTVDGAGIVVEQLEAKSDWVSLTALGTLTFEEIRSISLEHLPRQSTNVAGRVQLDRLAAMLPRTLQLREGVRIDAGELEFSASGQPGEEGFGWTAAVAASKVAGTDGSRAIRWDEPIEANIVLNETAAGPQMTQLAVSAPFAEGSFKTSEESITGSFHLDLERLALELGQFVDFGQWEFHGQGEGDLTFARQANEGFEATATIQLTDLKIAQAGQIIWAEPRLQAEITTGGMAVGLEPQQLTSGLLTMHGVSDQLEVELLEPVAWKAENSSYQLRVQGNGPLASWAGRLRPWVSTVPAEMSGEAFVKATLQIAPGRVHVLESEGSVAQLRVRSETLSIDEQRVQFNGDCLWDSTNNSLETKELQFLSTSMTILSRNLAVQLSSSETPTATGQVAFRGDLERLASITGLVGQQESTWLKGMLAGTMDLASDAQQLRADISANIEQLQVVRSPEQAGAAYGRPVLVWAEPDVKLAGRATYLIANDRVQFENFSVDGKSMRLSGRSILDKPTTTQQLQADGTLQYDSAEFAKLLANYLGPEVQVLGDQQIRFEVAGRLSQEAAAPLHWSQRFNVTAEAGWSSAAIYGLPIGTGRLQGTVSEGRLQVAPLDLAVGQGRLVASPRGVLAPEPAYLLLPKGLLFSSVEISPQVSETMLKYVAPIVAGATRTDGKFSVDLDDTQILLANPKMSRVSGRLSVHRLNVAPGPMMATVVRLVKQIEALSEKKQLLQAVGSPGNSSLLSIDNRQIDFQVADGRVYHRNLEFLVDGVPVQSQGSVGFDQTLSLLIEIPIQDKWIEKKRALRTLAGQSIRIPMQGTFQQPRIDERAVADLSRQLLQGVATEAIGGEINRALDKLFKGR